MLKEFEDGLRKCFKLSTAVMLGITPVRVLGMVVVYDQDSGVVTLSQAKYAEELLARAGMADCNNR